MPVMPDPVMQHISKELMLDAASQIDALRAENERLRAREAEARTLILSAPLHMPTWPEAEARNSWVRDSQRWLASPELKK